MVVLVLVVAMVLAKVVAVEVEVVEVAQALAEIPVSAEVVAAAALVETRRWPHVPLRRGRKHSLDAGWPLQLPNPKRIA